MFSEKMTEIFKVLNAPNKELARYTSMDAATISRLKTGKLTPKKTSSTIQKFLRGAAQYAKEQKKAEDLLKLLEKEKIPTNINNLENNLKIWLYTCTDTDFLSFGNKLSELMDIAALTNVKLGHMLNIDPSLISRFRNGHRTPKSDPEMLKHLCRILTEQICTTENTSLLVKLLHISQEDTTNTEQTANCIKEWLCDSRSGDAASIEQLLQRIDSIDLAAVEDLPSFSNGSIKDHLNDDSSYYIGNEGLRKAVIRFLSTAIINNAKELFLYSDQEMDWLLEDSSFTKTWFTLMAICMRQGIQIKIIHNINRNISEMLDGIRQWMPLYMTGMIEPYYCTSKNGDRFRHTLFLCPEIACIEASHTINSSEKGIYNYYTDELPLAFFNESFNKLLTQSKHLMKMNLDTPDIKKEDSLSTGKYENIHISMTKSSVVVNRTNAPYISFTFFHPLMYRAFKLYIEQQK